MRDGYFPYIDMEEIEALAQELEDGDGMHVIAHDEELVPHKECVSCWCQPVLVYRDKNTRTEIWAHQRTADNTQ